MFSKQVEKVQFCLAHGASAAQFQPGDEFIHVKELLARWALHDRIFHARRPAHARFHAIDQVRDLALSLVRGNFNALNRLAHEMPHINHIATYRALVHGRVAMLTMILLDKIHFFATVPAKILLLGDACLPHG
jgi:hypothetical protein